MKTNCLRNQRMRFVRKRMNLYSKCVVTLIGAILACGLSVSCSSDEPQTVVPESFKDVAENPLGAPNLPGKDNFDAGFFRDFLTQGEVVSLKVTSLSMLISDPEKGWTGIDYEEFLGFEPATPGMLVFSKAEVYEDVLRRSLVGPHPLYLPWKKFCLDNGENIKVWFKCPTEIDVQKGIVKYAKSQKRLVSAPYQLNFTSFGSHGIAAYSIRGLSGDSSVPAFLMEKVSMEIAEKLPLGDKNNPAFDSESDACEYMLGQLRAKYGRYVDITQVYPAADVSSRVEDIDEIERKVNEWLSNEW